MVSFFKKSVGILYSRKIKTVGSLHKIGINNRRYNRSVRSDLHPNEKREERGRGKKDADTPRSFAFRSSNFFGAPGYGKKYSDLCKEVLS